VGEGAAAAVATAIATKKVAEDSQMMWLVMAAVAEFGVTEARE
jgi:hypothetical protein